MKLALFYDTETTGLPLFKKPSEDPLQPHIVQIAALLADLETGKTVSSLDLTIKPDGWTIPDEVAAIHGITNEIATATGVSEATALGAFMALWERASVRIGHNESFDARILRIALKRYGLTELADVWKGGNAECTQLLSTPILKLPPTDKMIAAGRHWYKSANLREAYKHFTGQELENAHSALADARACMAVYFAMKEQGGECHAHETL